jgi:hypothetical protein
MGVWLALDGERGMGIKHRRVRLQTLYIHRSLQFQSRILTTVFSTLYESLLLHCLSLLYLTTNI